MRFEPVYLFVDYRDDSRAGIAEYEGRPHVFAVVQPATDEAPAVYSLVPVPETVTFPVPADVNLWDAPDDMRLLVDALKAEPSSLRKLGMFQAVSRGHAPDSFEVCWESVDSKG